MADFPSEPNSPLPPQAAPEWKWVRSALLVVLALIFWALVLFLNYLRALRWAGVINAESSGYMLGGCIFSGLLALLVVYLVNRWRAAKFSMVTKHVLIAAIAVIFSVLSLSGERTSRNTQSEAKQKIAHLLKQASGQEAIPSHSEWYDEPTRQFFRDIISLNQGYTQELDMPHRTNLKGLYNTASYSSLNKMHETVSELKSILAIDRKYESVGPILSKFENAINGTSASEKQKYDFIEGVHSSSRELFDLRSRTFQNSEEWLQASIDLYEFTIAHFRDYSVRENKLVFSTGSLLTEFQERQTRAIALRDSLREARAQFKSAQNASMERTGMSDELAPLLRSDK